VAGEDGSRWARVRAALPARLADVGSTSGATADELTLVTIRRLYYIGMIAAPVHLAHLVVFWSVTTTGVDEERWRLGILAAHGTMLVVMVAVALTAARLRHRPRPGRAGRVLCWSALGSVLLAGAAIATVDQWVTASILPFLIACVIGGLIFLLPPRRMAIVFLGAYVLFASVLGLTQDDPSVLVSNRVNAITTAALGFGLAFLLWRSESRNAAQQRQITAQQLELEQRNAELARLAATDALTGVANRHSFETSLREEQVRMQRFGHDSSLVLIDLDHFKRVNDAHGHPIGDRALQEAAVCIERTLRDVDVLARWGGEEFAVLLPMTPLRGAAAIAERLRATVEAEPFEVDGVAVPITVSIGVAEIVPDGPDALTESYQIVDHALYEAKHSGRNRVVAHDRGGGRVELR
jgi:diguanylate cyclase